MKKRLIALFALSGVAVAATAPAERTETLWTMQFGNDIGGSGSDYKIITSNGSTYSPTVYDVNGLTNADFENHWTQDISGVVTSGNKRVHLVGNTGVTWGDNFQFEIVFTMPETSSGVNFSASNNWPVVATLYDGSNNVRFGPYTGNQNYFNLDGTDGNVFSKGDKDIITLTGGQHTALLTIIDHKVTLHLDGEYAGSATLDKTAYAADKSVNNIALGGDTGSNYRINECVQSIAMYKVVPEPTTATLSLLALAGLAARRRRK